MVTLCKAPTILDLEKDSNGSMEDGQAAIGENLCSCFLSTGRSMIWVFFHKGKLVVDLGFPQ